MAGTWIFANPIQVLYNWGRMPSEYMRFQQEHLLMLIRTCFGAPPTLQYTETVRYVFPMGDLLADAAQQRYNEFSTYCILTVWKGEDRAHNPLYVATSRSGFMEDDDYTDYSRGSFFVIMHRR